MKKPILMEAHFRDAAIAFTRAEMLIKEDRKSFKAIRATHADASVYVVDKCACAECEDHRKKHPYKKHCRMRIQAKRAMVRAFTIMLREAGTSL